MSKVLLETHTKAYRAPYYKAGTLCGVLEPHIVACTSSGHRFIRLTDGEEMTPDTRLPLLLDGVKLVNENNPYMETTDGE